MVKNVILWTLKAMKKFQMICLCAAVALMMTACGERDEEREEYDEEYDEKYDEEYDGTSWETDDMELEQGSTGEIIEAQSFGVERQLEIYAQQRDVWAGTGSMDRYCYTLADLNYSGNLILITSEFGGTGFYTYSRFFQIDETGNVVELSTSFTEFDSQPDLLLEEEIVFYHDSSSSDGGHYCYIVHDDEKVSATDYVYETGALSMEDGTVTYTRLAVREVQYVGEDHTASVTSEDFEGNALTEEEYENFADSYYSGLGYDKGGSWLEWAEVADIVDMSEEEAMEELVRVCGVD